MDATISTKQDILDNIDRIKVEQENLKKEIDKIQSIKPSSHFENEVKEILTVIALNQNEINSTIKSILKSLD